MTSLISDADTWTSSLRVSVQQIRQYVAAVEADGTVEHRVLLGGYLLADAQ